MNALIQFLSFAFLSFTILKFVFKPLWHPSYFSKPQDSKHNIPYDKLCVSALLSKMSYESLPAFKEMSRFLITKYPFLKDTYDKIIFEDDTQLHMLDGTKIRNDVLKSIDMNSIDIDSDTTCMLNDTQDTQLFMWARDRQVFVVFRGTDSKNDILADLDVRYQQFGKEPGVRVHSGFLNQFKAIEPRLTAFLEDRKNTFDKITFIGHSLGMSCALLSSLFYTEYLDSCVEIHCHGFGGPRVGNKEFSQFFEKHTHLVKNTWQIRHFGDLIPLLPFSARFHHVASPTLRIYKEKVNFTEDKKDNAWYVRPLLMFSKINLFGIFQAHDIDKYIEIIARQYEIHHRTSLIYDKL